MTKLLMVVNGLHPNGAESFAFSISEQLKKKYDYQISFAYVREEETTLSKIVHARLQPQFTLYSLGKKPYSGVKGFINAYRRLKNVVSENDFDMVISQCELPDLMTAALPGRLFKLRVLQNAKEWVNNPVTGKLLEKWYISSRFKYNTAVSHSVKQIWNEQYGIQMENTTVIPNGVDAVFFDHFKERQLEGQKKLNIAIVGRLEKQKGHKYLLEAVNLLKNKIALSVSVAGLGALDNELKAFVTSHQLEGIVKFVGSLSREQLLQLYQSTHILVMPSLFEGLPLAAIEAMAVGIPVLGSRVPGIVDCINERNGLLFEPANPADLAEKIEYVMNNPGRYAALSKQAGIEAKQYAYSNLCDQYHTLITGLLSNVRR